jgi:hypothetical protein
LGQISVVIQISADNSNTGPRMRHPGEDNSKKRCARLAGVRPPGGPVNPY